MTNPNDYPPPPQNPQPYGTPQGFPPPPPSSGYATPSSGYATPSSGYASQPGQYAAPAPYYGPDPSTSKNWMNVVSLVCSLGSILVGPAVIAGIIFGHLGVKAANRGEANNRGLGVAGLVIGYIFLVIGLLAIAAYVIFIVYAVNNCDGSDAPSWCSDALTFAGMG